MGNPLGEHGIIRKVRPWPYEELSRIVLAVHHPEGIGRGRRVEKFVQTVDVPPTILDFLGVSEGRDGMEVSLQTQGASLKPLIEGEIEWIRDFAIAGFYRRSWSIRNEEFSFYLWSLENADKNGDTIVGGGERTSELYRIDRNFMPPRPERWHVGEEPERENIIEDNRDLASELEAILRRELKVIK